MGSQWHQERNVGSESRPAPERHQCHGCARAVPHRRMQPSCPHAARCPRPVHRLLSLERHAQQASGHTARDHGGVVDGRNRGRPAHRTTHQCLHPTDSKLLCPWQPAAVDLDSTTGWHPRHLGAKLKGSRTRHAAASLHGCEGRGHARWVSVARVRCRKMTSRHNSQISDTILQVREISLNLGPFWRSEISTPQFWPKSQNSEPTRSQNRVLDLVFLDLWT